MNRRRFLFAAGGLAALGAAPLLRGRPIARVERTARALGAQVSITAHHEAESAAAAAIDAAFAELDLVEDVMSLYRPQSQLCRLNRDGVLERPHPHLVRVLRAALDMSRRTDGAFDPTVQPLWALHAAGEPPAEALAAARRKVDWRAVNVSEERIRMKPGMALTLNGIAQGFASDRVRAVLEERGVRHALVNAGEIGALGRKPGGEAWRAGIQHPRRPDAYVALADLDDRFMATSGDYETRFSEDFRRHHIFDPATGMSPAALSSATILAASGIEADALSTAVFVLGPERGLRLVAETPRAEAFLVLKDGATVSTGGFPGVTS